MHIKPKRGQRGRLTIPEQVGYFFIGLLIACALSFILLWGLFWTFP